MRATRRAPIARNADTAAKQLRSDQNPLGFGFKPRLERRGRPSGPEAKPGRFEIGVGVGVAAGVGVGVAVGAGVGVAVGLCVGVGVGEPNAACKSKTQSGSPALLFPGVVKLWLPLFGNGEPATVWKVALVGSNH